MTIVRLSSDIHQELIHQIFTKIRIKDVIWSTIRYALKRNENISLYKNFYVNIHCIIHNRQKVETIQLCINWWVENQNVIYLQNRIFFSNKTKWCTDIFCNMDEPQKHYAKLLAYCERSHTEKITYCMIPFMCNIQYRQIHEDRK